jgi:hypothetical protein
MTPASTSKLILINGALGLKAPLSDPRKLLRVERYLARQSRNAHNLGLPTLEQYYLTTYLALKLWRMERFAENGGAR